MIDHLLRFTDEATAQADSIVGRYYSSDAQAWRGDVCIPGVHVYQVTGTETLTDPDSGQTYQRDIKSYFDGWFVVIALTELDPNLRDLPNKECRIITDRDAAETGSPYFMLYVADDIGADTLATARIEPLFAGSNYPFGP